ncbi:hypothetical protein [Prosthecobacter sp.]|uniref:hypothetical protein n=1 Tax=Prosthecobacter sp. TaxID=1965333 RepID=UPI003783B8F1
MKLLFRTSIAVLAVIGLLSVVGASAGLWWLCHEWTTDSSKPVVQHLTDHLSTLSRDRDRLLPVSGKELRGKIVKPADLPESLRVPGLLHALIHDDRITLVTYHSPDTDSGFRVWKSGMGEGFADQPTAIPFVTRFRYCDDYPVSSENRLE